MAPMTRILSRSGRSDADSEEGVSVEEKGFKETFKHTRTVLLQWIQMERKQKPGLE